MDGSSCSVLAEEIGGNLEVSNSYKYVITKGTAGSIKISGNSSPVTISDVRALPKLSRIEVITSYKPITLSLPADTDVSVAAQTKYGKIRSDWAVYLPEDDENFIEIGRKRADTAVSVFLKTSADITIRKQ